jgi:hypothetical protein
MLLAGLPECQLITKNRCNGTFEAHPAVLQSQVSLDDVANLDVSYAAWDKSEENKGRRGRFEDDKIGLVRRNNVQSHYAFG